MKYRGMNGLLCLQEFSARSILWGVWAEYYRQLISEIREGGMTSCLGLELLAWDLGTSYVSNNSLLYFFKDYWLQDWISTSQFSSYRSTNPTLWLWFRIHFSMIWCRPVGRRQSYSPCLYNSKKHRAVDVSRVHWGFIYYSFILTL